MKKIRNTSILMYKPRRESYPNARRGAGRYSDSRPPYRENRDRGGFGGRDRDDRPSFEATCATCQKPCRVPFRPNGSKPVLCKVCFEQENGGAPRSRFPETRTYRPNPMVRSLDRHEAPTPSVSSDVEARLKRIEQKLDTIIEAINEPMDDEMDEMNDEIEEKIEKKAEEVVEAKTVKKTKKETKEEKPKVKKTKEKATKKGKE